jgi:glycosyltransferase involved in cell wall biosynthesis
MRVLVIIGHYPPDHSGAGLRISRTYAAMQSRHPELSWRVIAEPVRMADSAQDLPHVVRLASSLPVPVLAARLLMTLLWNARKIDLVHCIGLTVTPVLGAFFSKLLRLPCVSETSLDYDPKRKSSGRIEDFLLRCYFKPDGVIALTPRIAAVHRAFGARDADIYSRPNPVMMDGGATLDAGLRRKIEAMPVRFRHLVLGRFCERKNQTYAVDILAHLPAAHGLVLAGPVLGDQDYVEMLRADIARSGLQDRVLLWPQAVNDPGGLYRLMTSLWCPSLKEGLPNVVLEMLWEGRPCFVNEALGLEGYVIRPENGAAFPAEDASRAAEIVQRSLDTGYDGKVIAGAAQAAFDPARITEDTFRFLNRYARARR